jgi:hypothetical protein
MNAKERNIEYFARINAVYIKYALVLSQLHFIGRVDDCKVWKPQKLLKIVWLLC